MKVSVRKSIWCKSFYTQKLSHTAHRSFVHTEKNRNFTSVFGDRPSFRVRKGCNGNPEIAILPQFLAIDPHFVRKGCAGQVEIAILPQFLAIEPHFVRKGCAGRLEIAILPQFLAIEPHFVRKGCRGSCEIAIFAAFDDRTAFRAKGLRRTS